jgi:micrococcal nuclease
VGAALALVLLSGCTPSESGAQSDVGESAASSDAAAITTGPEASAAEAAGGGTAKGAVATTSTTSARTSKTLHGQGKGNPSATSSSHKVAAKATARYRVIRVVDGDTVKVDINGGESVRIIGIDAPESVHPDQPVECGGVEASAKARALLEGQRVALVFDSSQAKQDRYGRLLAYVEVPGTGDFGEAMLRAGHAEEYTYAAAYRRQATYRRAEQQAKGAGRGIWGSCSQASVATSTSAAPTHVAPPPSQTQAPKPPPAPPAPKPTVPKPPVAPVAPGPGWTNDSLTPGYSGCRQGYPGGKINGVYWWKPIAC